MPMQINSGLPSPDQQTSAEWPAFLAIRTCPHCLGASKQDEENEAIYPKRISPADFDHLISAKAFLLRDMA